MTSRAGIPLTSPVKTFLDLATVTGPITLERAINEADKLDVIDADSLRKALEDHPGQPGICLLRHVLDEHTFRLSDDELERFFRPLATAAGLPTPLTKVMVDEFEVDFFWPELGLVVETDGWRYHRTPSAQTRDALRFQRTRGVRPHPASLFPSPGQVRTPARGGHPQENRCEDVEPAPLPSM